MEALKGSKSVLVRTFLYKKRPIKIWIVEIPYVILNLMFVSPMVMSILLEYYTIYLDLKNGVGFKDISDSLYMICGTSSACFIYSSYAQSSHGIITLMELIDSVVENRKCNFMSSCWEINAENFFSKNNPQEPETLPFRRKFIPIAVIPATILLERLMYSFCM